MTISIVTKEQIESLRAVAERLDKQGLEDESRVLHEILAQLLHVEDEVPASVAAEILRMTPQTIRNWIRAGILPGRQDQTGHFYVSLAALEPAIRMRQVLPDIPEGTFTDEEIDAAIEEVRGERRTRSPVGIDRREGR